MKKLYLVNQESYDYDMIQNIIVVAENEEQAKNMAIEKLQDCIFYNENNDFPIVITEITLNENKVIASYR